MSGCNTQRTHTRYVHTSSYFEMRVDQIHRHLEVRVGMQTTRQHRTPEDEPRQLPYIGCSVVFFWRRNCAISRGKNPSPNSWVSGDDVGCRSADLVYVESRNLTLPAIRNNLPVKPCSINLKLAGESIGTYRMTGNLYTPDETLDHVLRAYLHTSVLSIRNSAVVIHMY